MKSYNSTRQLNAGANEENGNGAALQVAIPQYEMFPSLFAVEGINNDALNIKRGEHGTSISLKKRTGKTDSLSAASGKTGDALKAWEREQRDKLKQKAAPVIAAILASPEYTFGNMRIGKNGAFSFRMPKVDAPKTPLITEDSILQKFSSEELQALADLKAESEAQKEAVEAGIAEAAAPAAE